jgi:cation transporter-like permease
MSESEGAGEDDGDTIFSRSALLLVATVVVGVAGSGIARRFLGEAGFETLGVVVFVLGYAGMVVVVWLGWIRPLEITGPTERHGSDRP